MRPQAPTVGTTHPTIHKVRFYGEQKKAPTLVEAQSLEPSMALLINFLLKQTAS